MKTKSLAADDADLQKKLKKLAALLDMSQGDIIYQALQDFEKKMLSGKNTTSSETQNNTPSSKDFVQRQLDKATEMVWRANPAKKARQLKLYSGPDTIDDYIITQWDSWLEP